MNTTKTPTNETLAVEQDIGPRKIGNAKLIYKTIVGIIGGLGGTMVVFIVFMLASSFLIQTDSTAGITLIQLYIILVMVFLATLIGNLVSVILFYIVDRDKYQKLTTLMTQGFIFNLLIFIFTIPLYLIIQGSSMTTLVYLIGVHFLLSAFITSIVMEILSASNYVLVGLYGNTFGVLAALVINLLLLQLNKDNNAAAFFLFLTMPIIWGSLGFFQSMIEMIYRWFYDVYGLDFLNKEAQYEEEEKEASTNESEDEKEE